MIHFQTNIDMYTSRCIHIYVCLKVYHSVVPTPIFLNLTNFHMQYTPAA